jgi:hypothetical protein
MRNLLSRQGTRNTPKGEFDVYGEESTTMYDSFPVKTRSPLGTVQREYLL